MKKVKNIFFIVLFIILIFGLGLLNLLNNTNEYLYFENRNIQSDITLNKDTLITGQYFQDLDEYLSDSFIFREELLKTATNINLNILHRPIVNDLYITEDNIIAVQKYWKSKYPSKDIEKMGKLYNNIDSRLKEDDIEFIYVGIPHHTTIFTDEYPEHFYNRHDEWTNIENDFFEYLNKYKVNNIKMRKILESNKKEYYNATDHHFSYLGAIKTYEEIIRTINNISGYDLDSDNLEIIKKDKIFKGSYSRKLFNLDRFQDKALLYNEDFDFTRTDINNDFGDRLFILEENTIEDTIGYGMYMGGDLPFTTINTNREELPNILIYGDSFTNPIETLLARNCNTMWSVDFRHYTEKDLLELVDELQPDFVICVRDNFSYILEEGNGQIDLEF